MEELCAPGQPGGGAEGIVDPTNVGAIFRSAAALHMDAVLVTPTCCDPLSRRAVRVSMGTLFQIPWTFLGTDASQWPQPGLERLKELGFQTAAMALDSTALSIEEPPGSARRRSWPSSWGQRGTAWPPGPSPSATSPCASPWPGGWTP